MAQDLATALLNATTPSNALHTLMQCFSVIRIPPELDPVARSSSQTAMCRPVWIPRIIMLLRSPDALAVVDKITCHLPYPFLLSSLQLRHFSARLLCWS